MPSKDVLTFYVGEGKPYYIDFSNVLENGDTLTGVSSLTSDLQGLSLNNIAASGTKVQVWLSASEEIIGKIAKITAVVTTSLGQTHKDFVRLSIAR